jgi:hypothetical protein
MDEPLSSKEKLSRNKIFGALDNRLAPVNPQKETSRFLVISGHYK